MFLWCVPSLLLRPLNSSEPHFLHDSTPKPHTTSSVQSTVLQQAPERTQEFPQEEGSFHQHISSDCFSFSRPDCSHVLLRISILNHELVYHQNWRMKSEKQQIWEEWSHYPFFIWIKKLPSLVYLIYQKQQWTVLADRRWLWSGPALVRSQLLSFIQIPKHLLICWSGIEIRVSIFMHIQNVRTCREQPWYICIHFHDGIAGDFLSI